MAYSPVTQPLPLSFKNGGTFSSTEAVQMTQVSPARIERRALRILELVGRDA